MNKLGNCRHGRMLFNQHDKYIGKALQLYGEFSEGECEVFSQIIRPGWTVLELGANIGAHTVVLGKLVGERGVVWAFEPQRIVFQTLCANVALNDLQNVVCRQQAIGEKSDSIVVPRLDYEKENNFGGISLGRYAENQGEKVEVVAIDSLQVPACHFIKIDIEGMEREALIGSEETIERCRPILYVENDRQEKSEALVRKIDDLGYHMYWHLPPMYNPNNFYNNNENVFGSIVSKNMLCFHRSVQHTVNAPRVAIP